MKKGIYKRILSCMLTLAMVISLISVSTMEAYAFTMIPSVIDEGGGPYEGEKTTGIIEGEELIDLNEGEKTTDIIEGEELADLNQGEGPIDSNEETGVGDSNGTELSEGEEEFSDSISFTGPVANGVTLESEAMTTSTDISVDSAQKSICANGNAIILKEGSETGCTNLYIDDNGNGLIDDGENPIDLSDAAYSNFREGNTTSGYDLSDVNICGGWMNTVSTGNTLITMLSGKVQGIYGGGYTPTTNYANVTGNTSINVLGGSVTKVYGGGYRSAVSGDTYITLKSGNIKEVYGGSYYASIGGNSNITVDGATVEKIYGGTYYGNVGTSNIKVISGNISKSIYGGGYFYGSILNSTNIEINGGTFSAVNIFGGWDNYNDSTLTSTNIIITDGTFTNCNIYGGGYLGSVGSSEENAECNVTIHGGIFNGYVNIYGGGNNGRVYGNTHITIDNEPTFNQAKVYGGGYQDVYSSSFLYSDITGDTSINIKGGTIHSVYGGGGYGGSGESATVQGEASITVNNGTIDNLYLGGDHEKSPVNTASIATIEGGTVNNIYKGSVSGTVSLTNNGGIISGYVEEGLFPTLIDFSVSADGASGTSTTTKLEFTFTQEPTSLTIDNITVTGAAKDALSGDGTVRILTISDIAVENGENITVQIEASGITTDSKTVQVYKEILPDISVYTINDSNGNILNSICANGNAIILKEGSETGYTNLYIDDNGNGIIDDGENPINLNHGAFYNGTLSGNTTTGFDLSNVTIYGGGKNTSFTGNTKITMLSGEVGKLYGGGMAISAIAKITGSTYITVLEGSVDYVYGGGNNASVSGNTNITLNGGKINHVRGGGYGEKVTGNTYITVDGATIQEDIYGTSAYLGTVNTSNITVISGTINGSIYGGGNSNNSTVLNSTNIEINGGTFSNGKIFGAGSYCSETKLTSTNINISDGTFTEFSIYGGGCYGVVGSSENNVNCNVTIHGGTFHNGVTIYGGGWNKSVYGNTYITINNGATFDQAVVYGGGYQSEYGSELYKYSDIIGDTSIDINGGNIESVYGGGRYGDYGASATVQGKADITVTEGTVNNIYLGGNHEKSQANTAIATIEGGTVTNIYTGTVAGEAFLDYTGGMIIGEVEEELLIPVSFTELKANDATTTTELTLKFSKDPISLTVDKITVTGATKGTLSGNGTERTLTISDITVKNGQNITVAIEAPAFKISPASKEVTVYKLVIPTLTDITLTPVKVNYADRATAGTKVADLAAVGTPTTGITYTLDGSSEDNSLFQIAGTALQIKSGTTLENGREYTVKVKVHENEEPLNTYSETISFEPIIPPTVTSITRQNPQTISTNADTVTYRVTFSEKVIGVDNSDFVLTGTGTVTGTVASISEVSESVMDVTVNGITGEGVLRLELKNSGTGITDIAGNAIDEGFTEGESYTVDRIAPALTAGQVTRTSDANATVKFTSNEAGTYYYAVVESGAGQPVIDTSGTGIVCGTTENTITLISLSKGAKDIYIVVKDASGNVSVGTYKISIPAYVSPTDNNGDNGGGNTGGGSTGGGSTSGGDIENNSSGNSRKIEKEHHQASDVPGTSLNTNEEELKAKVFSSDELSKIATGENAKVIIKVTNINDSVSESHKKQIQEKLEAEQPGAAEATLLYVDITLFKQIGNTQETKVTNTNGKISISIEVPESMRNETNGVNRIYRVIRIHDNVAEILDGTYDPVTHLFTFETDRFSTYALTYKDVEKHTDTSDDNTESKLKVYNDFNHLRLTVTSTKTSQKLSYKKVSGAEGYLIYQAKCGQPLKELADVKKDVTSHTVKNLKKGTCYKYQVKAYKIIDGEKVIIATSRVVHSITEHKTYGNPIKVTSKVESVKLSVGKTKTVTCQVVLPKGKKLKHNTTVLRYESSNKSIATVSSEGKIKAKAKGTCYIYVYAQNGVYRKDKVTVK